jgi:tripartite-type tricarboxylate transporter receptor subunit TctC
MPALRILLAGVVLSLGAAAVAQTSAYPQRPIKVLHGFSAGGAPDAVLRQVAVRLERALGTPVVVENRPGASGTIAAAAVARAEPDGYTLLFGVAANLAVAPAFAKPPPYDPVGAFAPIVEVARGPYVWLVRDDAPARTMTEFVQWARARPGQPNYASPGEGSVHHLATEMLKQAAGLDLVHVPVTTGLYLPLIGGQVDAMFDSMPSPLPHLASGKLRALAVTGPKRLAALPDVPTLAEQGIPGIDVNSWWGFVGPAGLPRDVVLRLNAEIRKALAEPELVAVLAKMAIEPSPGTPEAFAAYLAQEAARWKQVAAKARP